MKMIQEGFRQNIIHAVTEIPIEKIIEIRQTEKFDEELIKENRNKRYIEDFNEDLFYDNEKLLKKSSYELGRQLGRKIAIKQFIEKGVFSKEEICEIYDIKFMISQQTSMKISK